MDDFIFGTLSTDELRAAHIRAGRLGVTHRSARSPRDPLPYEPVTVELTAGPDHPCTRAWVYWTTDGQDPGGSGGVARHGQTTRMELVDVRWDTLVWGYVCRFRAALPGQPAGTVLRYRMVVQGLSGEEVLADGGEFFAVYIDEDPLPEWSRQAVIYQIFVDRFFPGSARDWLEPESLAGFYGGTLRGITERLDYIADLGADTLWLTPIFPSPSHHGYDATDYFSIEPRLGSKEDLESLLESAHARGMRVLLDFVASHWSRRHPTFQQALIDPESPYVDWYRFTGWPKAYESFFGVKDLPQINLRNPEARAHLIEAAEYWLEFGVDGYRLDYAIGPAKDFWADFRRATRRVQTRCWTFGEVVEPSDSQIAFHGLLDGCLDFMLLEALRETFAFGRWTARVFTNFLDRHEAFFPAGYSRPSFLDNHDMNRFLWISRGDRRRLKLAALCQFTLPGAPVIYYGTEVGLSQERDIRQGDFAIPEEARLPMRWGAEQDRELFAFYKALIAFRRAHPVIWNGKRRTVQADEGMLVYAVQAGGGGEALLVAINLADEPGQAALDAGGYTLALASDPGYRIPPAISESGLELPPLTGVVLLPDRSPKPKHVG